MKSKTENLLIWEQRIKERVQSRMTVNQWCLKNGLSKHQYNYWNRRVRKKQNSDEGVVFADITSTISKEATVIQNSTSSSEFRYS